MRRSKRAFTLIELLVVIAIIAVLMGILMPALGKVRKQARAAACLSQLKQWSLVWAMYTDNNEGKFPDGVIPANQRIGGSMPRGQWVTALRKGWEKHPEMLLCPSAKTHGGITGNEGSFDKSYLMSDYLGIVGDENLQEEASYGMNNWAFSTNVDLQGRKAEWHWKNVYKVLRQLSTTVDINTYSLGVFPTGNSLTTEERVMKCRTRPILGTAAERCVCF